MKVNLIIVIVTGVLSHTKHWQDCTGPHPLCGSNGVTYENYCLFKRALADDPLLEIAERSNCTCTIEEKFTWDPLCGTNGEIYSNNCEFQKANTYNNDLEISYRDLCREFKMNHMISRRELNKIMSWKSFMPQDLYSQLMKRSVKDKPAPDTFFLRNLSLL